VTGSFLLAKRQKFGKISEKLKQIKPEVLKNITERLKGGERVKPESDDEKLCFSVLDSIDHIGGHVKGSLTNKKHM